MASNVEISLENLAREANLDPLSPEFARYLDKQDKLAYLREEFFIPSVQDVLPENEDKPRGPYKAEEDCIYLCGNSLGLLPKKAKQYVEEELDVWAHSGVHAHHHHKHGRPWVTIDEEVCKLSASIVGGKPIEVASMATLTSNLHFLLTAFYKPTEKRHKILMEYKAFPSDHYAVESQIKYHGFDPVKSLVTVAPREGEYTIRTEDILKAIEAEGDSVAVVLFSGIQYYTGQFFEIEKITEAAHKKGCIAGFDLAHAVGNVPLQLHDWDVDFACWCTYKYLNSGPGGIGGLFVHERFAHDFDRPRFSGWWGHNKTTRFQMNSVSDPLPGAAGFQMSNPSVLTTVSLLGGLELFEKASMKELRQKSLLLTGYLEFLLDQLFDKSTFSIMTPRDPSQRGCQLSFLFGEDVKELYHQLSSSGVVCDIREPNSIRIAPVPLYNSFSDVYKFISLLRSIKQQ
ncbi:kynureninase-like protein [Basidiobolus meristosporus CBS 931.73]|uniref:Kynureninase n=1 Tax=Basidiobolus meristosporus CBS 931.73 TaxID=1314790 RepID=A0A1Y1Z677_9FUNG|nr:kynureninase-like protein [Basidiobolus meristosporus CBS 931.73]|eukprot:ORY05740.1 kynureninase-like protein [Basidiobolus meristosporus CBS 931.73]